MTGRAFDRLPLNPYDITTTFIYTLYLSIIFVRKPDTNMLYDILVIFRFMWIQFFFNQIHILAPRNSTSINANERNVLKFLLNNFKY